jgi:hypothetical protein
VSDQPSATHDSDEFGIDPQVPRMARVENYITGGVANFASDRALVDDLADAARANVDQLRGAISAMKSFMARAVRLLAGEQGIDQFLYIGMATPQHEMIHEVAQKVVPRARVVYASYDPTTLAHVHTILKDVPAGTIGHVQSSFDDPGKIVREASATLDFARPVAVLLPTSLNLIADDDVAQRIVDGLGAAMVPGSHMALAHTSTDIDTPGTVEVVAMLDAALDERYVSRTTEGVLRLLAAFELLEPGLVPVEQWRPEGDPPALGRVGTVPIYGAVGRRP